MYSQIQSQLDYLFTEMGKTVLKLQIDYFDEKIGVLVFCTYELRQPF